MDVEGDTKWQIEVWRTASIIYTEDIELVVHSDFETHYDDDYLRANSFSMGGGNNTSHATRNVKRQARKVNIYVKNIYSIKGEGSF